MYFVKCIVFNGKVCNYAVVVEGQGDVVSLLVGNCATGEVLSLDYKQVLSLKDRCLGYRVVGQRTTIAVIYEKYLPLVPYITSMRSYVYAGSTRSGKKVKSTMLSCDFNSLCVTFVRQDLFDVRTLLDYLVYLVRSGDFNYVVSVSDSGFTIRGATLKSSEIATTDFMFEVSDMKAFLSLLTKIAMF